MKKEEIRSVYLNKRKSLSPERMDEISCNIYDLIYRNYHLEEKNVSIFLPIERTKEINTYKILEKAISLDSSVFLPKIKDKLDLNHLKFVGNEQLEISPFGIPEPKFGEEIEAYSLDYVFVPLLAFDSRGHRVGYGGGYYDRFLKQCSGNCKIIGLSHFDVLETNIIDIHDEDIRLDLCVTPDKIYKFEKQ